jgi:hypothetical protein
MNEEKRDESMQANEPETVCPRLNVKDLILSLGVILLCGCILSGAIPVAFIGLAMLALFAYVVIAVRNIGAVIQLLLTSILVTLLTFLPICGAAVLALMLGAGTLAWLFMVLPKYKWLPTTLLIVAYALGFLVTSNPVTPLLSLAFVPAAALMAWAHARDLGRTSTVLHAFLGFVIAMLATLCVILWRAYGAINYDVLMRFVNELKQLFVTIGTEAGKMLWESIEATSAQTAIPVESLEKLRELYAQAFSESTLRTLADMIMGLTPALIAVPALIVSYLSNVVLLRKYYNTEWRSHMTPAACTLTVSPASGVIYFVCLLIVMFVSKQSVFLMAVTNMCFILMPGLCLTGVNVILHSAKQARGWMGVVSILFFVAVICCMGLSSLYFVALWGAYTTISVALHQKIMEKMKENERE